MSTNQDNGNAAAMRAALVNLTRPTETDICGLENIAKYAMDHSMYGGGVLQALCGAIREGKLALAEPPRNCARPRRLKGGRCIMTTDEIHLDPCPFCGADVRMTAGRPVCGTFPARSYTYTHPSGDCVVRRSVVFVNLREAREWAAAWNRRAGA